MIDLHEFLVQLSATKTEFQWTVNDSFFALRGVHMDRSYCPITAVCMHTKQMYFRNIDWRNAAESIQLDPKIAAAIAYSSDGGTETEYSAVRKGLYVATGVFSV